MNDLQLAAALRSRSTDALPELLDAYGDQLFSYSGACSGIAKTHKSRCAMR